MRNQNKLKIVMAVKSRKMKKTIIMILLAKQMKPKKVKAIQGAKF